MSCCITGSYRRVRLLHHLCLPKRVCYCTLYLQRRVSCCRAAKNCLQKSFLQRHCYQGMSCCITITYRQSGLLQYCYAKKSTLKTYFYICSVWPLLRIIYRRVPYCVIGLAAPLLSMDVLQHYCHYTTVAYWSIFYLEKSALLQCSYLRIIYTRVSTAIKKCLAALLSSTGRVVLLSKESVCTAIQRRVP